MLNQDSVVGRVLVGRRSGIRLQTCLQHNSFAIQSFQRMQLKAGTVCLLIKPGQIESADCDYWNKSHIYIIQTESASSLAI
jgi:hypothetical protein